MGAGAEQKCGRFDADQRVVLGVLMRIDGVVTDHPGDRSGVERKRRRIDLAERHRKTHQRAPRERQPQDDLRPPGNAFHERIDRDDNQRGDAGRHREAVELQQYRQSDQRLNDEKESRLRHTHLPRRDWSRPRPLNQRIKIAIGYVVPGATGAAHDD